MKHLQPDLAMIECRQVKADPCYRKCGAEGVPRDTVTRRLAHEPCGHRPTTLLVQARWSQGRRGHNTDPLYHARRTLLAGRSCAHAQQQARFEDLLSNELHAKIEASWASINAWSPPTAVEK